MKRRCEGLLARVIIRMLAQSVKIVYYDASSGTGLSLYTCSKGKTPQLVPNIDAVQEFEAGIFFVAFS